MIIGKIFNIQKNVEVMSIIYNVCINFRIWIVKMPILVDSGSEVDSEEERRERKKAKHRSKSRSR